MRIENCIVYKLNGRVTYNVTWPWKVKVVTRNILSSISQQQ